jgi:putative acetyltransferase
MIIREEKPSDISEITNVHDQAFNGEDEGRIVERLRRNNKLAISLVCEMNGKVVGHIAYSPVYNERRIIGVGLGPVGVLPSFQRQGIGSRLIEQGDQIAFSNGHEKIFVLGYPDYYSRFGFEIAGKYGYYSAFDPDGNHFMVKGKGMGIGDAKIEVDYCDEFLEKTG